MSLRQFIDGLTPDEIQFLQKKMDTDPLIQMDLTTLQIWLKQRRSSRSTLKATAKQFSPRRHIMWDDAMKQISTLSDEVPLKQILFREIFEFLLFFSNMSKESKIHHFERIINMIGNIVRQHFHKQMNMTSFQQCEHQLQNPEYRNFWKTFLKQHIISSRISRKQLQEYIVQKMDLYGKNHRVLQTVKKKCLGHDIEKTNAYLRQYMPFFIIEQEE
jgi:hypothetical protein